MEQTANQFLEREPVGMLMKKYAVIIQTAQELAQMNTVFYSGHCTGIPAFDIMKEIMGDKLIALHSGKQII